MVALSGCSSSSDGGSEGRPAVDLAGCAPAELTTLTAGRLTLATGPVTRAPWVVGAATAGRSPDPREGKGYDAAVGYAVAERLGYSREAVTWVATPFLKAIAAGAKPFDVDVNQITITKEGAATIDLTSPYFVVPQAVVTLSSRPAAAAKDLAALKDESFAVVRDSPAQAALAGVGQVTAYDELDDVRRAVGEAKQDLLVTDLVTAMRMDSDDQQLVDGDLVGTLDRRPGPAEEFGLALAKDSPLTRCVDAALTSLREDGTLDALEQRWLHDETGWVRLR